jgi:hypothetical protein
MKFQVGRCSLIYVGWIKRYVLLHGKLHPKDINQHFPKQ